MITAGTRRKPAVHSRQMIVARSAQYLRRQNAKVHHQPFGVFLIRGCSARSRREEQQRKQRHTWVAAPYSDGYLHQRHRSVSGRC